MIEEKSEGQAIQDGDIVRQFLENTVVKDAFDRVNKRYLAQFSSSDDKDEIMLVHARARALVDVAKELRAVVSNGEMATRQRQQRTEREEQLRRNTRKPSR